MFPYEGTFFAFLMSALILYLCCGTGPLKKAKKKEEDHQK